jgi:hypothetical protein
VADYHEIAPVANLRETPGTLPSWCHLQFDTSRSLDCYANPERTLFISICESANRFELHRLLDASTPKVRMCFGDLDEDKSALEEDYFRP